jgi:hypothetical protein
MLEFTFDGEIVIGQGEGAWHFIQLPLDLGEQLTRIASGSGMRGRWGSLKVEATVGHTTWNTSIFPDEDGSFLLPVKAEVRKAEDVGEGDLVEVILELL